MTGHRRTARYVQSRTHNEREEQLIVDAVRRHCANGSPITLTTLINSMKREVKELHLEHTPFAQRYLVESPMIAATHFRQYLNRLLNRNGYSTRKTTISQSVPYAWDRQARAAAARVRATLVAEGANKIVGADEVPMLQQPLEPHVLAPRGDRRVGRAAAVDEKEGCTLMLSVEYTKNEILDPCIIFQGVPGAVLQQRWVGFTGAQVMFTRSHWMTRWTFIEYLRCVKQL
eukprot:GHVU01107708.1.p1 GENE.GHVU01107708.1~~GHVU01107708.1.p1  ORF type:complete len:230 (+),score=21.43 GHVU01107708.1:268-957(+)